MAQPRILVADDQRDVLESLRFLLKTEGFHVTLVEAPRAALSAIEKDDFDAALIDLNYARDTTSGQEGIDLLNAIRRIDADLPVVVMTAWGSIELAVDAMRSGAGDFIEKPWENSRLLSILRNQVALGRAVQKGHRLEAENRLLRGEESPSLIAQSAAMSPVLALIERVGPSDANILITGENGTGKGLVARVLHQASGRADRPLITVDIGGLAASVFESELFGHVRGAFTDARQDRVGRFELADGGTLLMDEIANLPPGQQPKLLRVIETGEFERVGSSKTKRVDVRLISATNADLGTAVQEGRFRQDLLFRLNTVPIHLPPLRDRHEDIEPLAESMLARIGKRYGRTTLAFDREAYQALHAHHWPGNVRELAHVVERAVLMSDGVTIGIGDLGLDGADQGPDRFEDMTLEEAERLLIHKALARHGGNVSHAATALGLSRSALYRRLEKFGPVPDHEP